MESEPGGRGANRVDAVRFAMERPERPSDGASTSEIAEWMEADFGWALATAPVKE